jgi:hypothetical protein
MSNGLSLGTAIACISIAVSRFRARYDVDYSLDWFAQLVRWGIAAIGFLITRAPGANLRFIRLGGLCICLLFVCWPNCAYHLTKWMK